MACPRARRLSRLASNKGLLDPPEEFRGGNDLGPTLSRRAKLTTELHPVTTSFPLRSGGTLNAPLDFRIRRFFLKTDRFPKISARSKEWVFARLDVDGEIFVLDFGMAMTLAAGESVSPRRHGPEWVAALRVSLASPTPRAPTNSDHLIRRQAPRVYTPA
jgi:hypothetical protein